MGLTSRRVVEASKSAQSARRLRDLDGRSAPNAGDDGPADLDLTPKLGRKRRDPVDVVLELIAPKTEKGASRVSESRKSADTEHIGRVIEGLASGTEADQKILRDAWAKMDESQKDDIVRVLHYEFRAPRQASSARAKGDAAVPSTLNPRGQEIERFLFDGGDGITPVKGAEPGINYHERLLETADTAPVRRVNGDVNTREGAQINEGLEQSRGTTGVGLKFDIVRDPVTGRRSAIPFDSNKHARLGGEDAAAIKKAEEGKEKVGGVDSKGSGKSERAEGKAFTEWFHRHLGPRSADSDVASAMDEADSVTMHDGVTADKFNYALSKLVKGQELTTAAKNGQIHPSELFRTPADMANAIIRLLDGGITANSLNDFPMAVDEAMSKVIPEWGNMDDAARQKAVLALPQAKRVAASRQALTLANKARHDQVVDKLASDIANHKPYQREGWTHTPMAAEPSRRTGDLESMTSESRLPPSNTAEPDVATEEIMSKIPTPPRKPRAPKAPPTPATPAAPSVADSPAGLTPEVSGGSKPRQRYYFKGIDEFSPKRQEVAGFVEADSPEQAAKLAEAKGVSGVTVRPLDAETPTVEAKPTTPQQRAEAAAARAIEGEKVPKQKELFGQGDEPPPGTPPAAPPGTDIIPSGPSPQMDTGDPTFRRDPNAVDEPSTRGSTRQLVPAGRLEVPETGSRALIVPDSVPKNVTDSLDNAGTELIDPSGSAIEPLVGELVPAPPRLPPQPRGLTVPDDGYIDGESGPASTDLVPDGPGMGVDGPNFRHPTGLSIPERDLAIPPNHQSTARPIDPSDPVEPEIIDGESEPASRMSRLGPRGVVPSGTPSGVDGPNFRPDPNAPKRFQGNVRPKTPGTPDATPDPADPKANQPKSWLRRALPYAAGGIGLAWLLNEGSRQNARDNQERIGGGAGGGLGMDGGMGDGNSLQQPMTPAEPEVLDAAGRLRLLRKLEQQGINPHTQTSINWTH